MRIVDNAFISGLTPRRIEDQILIGRVVADGPAVNDAITRSSSESVKAKSHPEITAGAIIGRVTNLKASMGAHPRSIAASSSERSNATSLAETTTDTKHMENVVCARIMVNMPLSSPMPIKRRSSERPVITSGITRGA